ncbi:DUF3192 domain-containing protein [Aliiglaciecola sp. CAU 1673]|uniref:DUF3192 domain-containing protein n=1 Tax=Aliiglaciecola sp. CAU 1673 TaxID=3032595 RepID=UPI0023DC5D74|nr:DUF3192 domain-containing protein [Aliiglaciecola sp. CAU 1673]MDF2179637.1 DUF3192 domain-containing protein [Aliiglaciecola sp. CAU 1673]
MRTKKLLVAALIPVALTLSGCVISVDGDGHYVDDAEKRELKNRKHLANLQPGMNVNQVMDKMGTPDFNEFLQSGENNYQVLYYRTQRMAGDGMTTKDECTPVVIKNGQLSGWGELALTKI